MVKQRAEEAVMFRHDAEALFQRCLLVAGGEAFVKVVHHRQVGIV